MFPVYLYLIQSWRMKAMRSVQRKINDVAVSKTRAGPTIWWPNQARSEPCGTFTVPVHQPRADNLVAPSHETDAHLRGGVV